MFGNTQGMWLALWGIVCVGWAAGCGGSSQPAESPELSTTEEESAPVAATPEPPVEPVPEAPAEPTEPVAVEPEFKPGMTVSEAVHAVPQGAERVEMEHDVLVAPLLDTELYAPCKLRPHQHFSVKVAVWDGRVVGLDLEAKPKGQAVEECLRKQIEGVTWKKKVKSLSTVEFNY
jgi:hypothetical protein